MAKFTFMILWGKAEYMFFRGMGGLEHRPDVEE